MTNKHTPGPWDRHFEDKECRHTGRKWRVDYITITTKFGSGKNLVNYIAEINGQCDANTSANARLIAAAPDLLAALENLLPVARAYLHIQQETQAYATAGMQKTLEDIEQSRATINRAKGL